MTTKHVLVEYLSERGETIAQLAGRLGVTRQSVYNWISGYSRPTVKRARAVSKLTGLDPAKLLGL